jgi:predicted nucleotidyltransferase
MSQVPRGLTLQDLRHRRDEIVGIAARRGAQNLRVFGSVARGEAGPESDLDLLVDLDADRNVLDLSELILDLEALLGVHVDVVETQRPSEAIRRLEQDAIVL